MKTTEQASGCSPVRLILYTDDTMLAFGTQSLLAGVSEFQTIIAKPEIFELVPLVERSQPDVILLDLAPEMTLGLISALRKAAPGARLLLWGRSFSDELRYQAGEMGVAGFLPRNLSADLFIKHLIDAPGGGGISVAEKPVHSKTVSLTNRESQLVTLLAQGLRNKEIATCIGITEGTVRIYLSKLFAKIGARDRLEVAVFGLKNAYCGQASWDGHNGFVTSSDEGRARPMIKSLVLVEPERRRASARQARAVGA